LEENVLSQEWHDSRYHAAIEAGVNHSALRPAFGLLGRNITWDKLVKSYQHTGLGARKEKEKSDFASEEKC
jgi:hypothetical protein